VVIDLRERQFLAVDLVGSINAGVERLPGAAVALQPVAQLAPVGLSVKTPWQCLRGAVREAPSRRGVSPRRLARGRKETYLAPRRAAERSFSPSASAR
jgi:hypothetical protein